MVKKVDQSLNFVGMIRKEQISLQAEFPRQMNASIKPSKCVRHGRRGKIGWTSRSSKKGRCTNIRQ